MKRVLTIVAIVALLTTAVAGPAAGAEAVGVTEEPASTDGVDLLEPVEFDGDDVDSDMFVGCYPKPELCGP